MPLRNSQLIHLRFEAHHRPTAGEQMTAECVIVRPSSSGTPVFDESTGTSQHPAATPVYEGPCRLVRTPLAATTNVVADAPVNGARYRVVVPVEVALAQVGDLVTITVCAGDPTIVGLPLFVRDVPHGSISWQRDLLCDFQQPATR